MSCFLSCGWFGGRFYLPGWLSFNLFFFVVASLHPFQLGAMGFDPALVLEVYFACNKNEELAANYLLDHIHEFEDWIWWKCSQSFRPLDKFTYSFFPFSTFPQLHCSIKFGVWSNMMWSFWKGETCQLPIPLSPWLGLLYFYINDLVKFDFSM